MRRMKVKYVLNPMIDNINMKSYIRQAYGHVVFFPLSASSQRTSASCLCLRLRLQKTNPKHAPKSTNTPSTDPKTAATMVPVDCILCVLVDGVAVADSVGGELDVGRDIGGKSEETAVALNVAIFISSISSLPATLLFSFTPGLA